MLPANLNVIKKNLTAKGLKRNPQEDQILLELEQIDVHLEKTSPQHLTESLQKSIKAAASVRLQGPSPIGCPVCGK